MTSQTLASTRICGARCSSSRARARAARSGTGARYRGGDRRGRPPPALRCERPATSSKHPGHAGRPESLDVHLSPREQEKLQLLWAAEVASRRRARGLRLNHPEAVAVLSAFVLEG